MTYDIVSINIGKPKSFEYRGRQEMTGIYKKPIDQKIFLSFENLEGDIQADLKHHGGVDKAVCAYCYDHYSYWENTFNIDMTPGFFGENLTIKNISEEEVLIGDTFIIGEAILQVSQPRIPCYKTSVKSGVSNLEQHMVRTGYTGFYFRVIKEGWVGPDDNLIQQEKAAESLSISFLNNIFYNDQNNLEAKVQISQLTALAPSWLNLLQQK